MSNSGDIKKILVIQYGGNESEWKRLVKSKLGEDWHRVFENAKLGKKVEVIESPDGSMAYELQKEAAAKASKGFPIETDADKVSEAIGLVERFLALEDEEERLSAEDQSRLSKAINNQFCFGIGYAPYLSCKPEITVWLRPLGDLHWDQHFPAFVEGSLPEGLSCASEGEYNYRGDLTLIELAEDLMRRGFVPNKESQEIGEYSMEENDIDPKLWKNLWPQLTAKYDEIKNPPQQPQASKNIQPPKP